MTNFPNFNKREDYEDFVGVYKERVENYVTFMNIVKDAMYGTGYGNYANIPGSCLVVVNEITRSLLYDADLVFKEIHPEYKTIEDQVFIPVRDFKHNISEALNEALDKRDQPWSHPDNQGIKKFNDQR